MLTRSAAQASRRRKQSYLEMLEAQVKELQREQELLERHREQQVQQLQEWAEVPVVKGEEARAIFNFTAANEVHTTPVGYSDATTN